MTTPRLGFTLDPSGQIGVQHENWDKADFPAGMVTQRSDAPVDTAKLFNGATVADTDLNRIRRRISGNWKQLQYPFMYRAQASTTVAPGTPGPWGWNEIAYDRCVNAGDANREASTNAFIPPITADYKMRMHFRWAEGGSGDRTVGFYYNGIRMDGYVDIRDVANAGGYGMNQIIDVNYKLTPTDRIRPYFFNNSGAGHYMFMALEVSLLNPVY